MRLAAGNEVEGLEPAIPANVHQAEDPYAPIPNQLYQVIDRPCRARLAQRVFETILRELARGRPVLSAHLHTFSRNS